MPLLLKRFRDGLGSNEKGSDRLLAGQRGYTLIEVIVAITLLGIGITVAAQLISTGLRSSFISKKYDRATAYGESLLGETLLSEKLTPGSDRGEFAGEGGYTWEREITLREREEPEEGEEEATWVRVYQVVVRVPIPLEKRANPVELTTLVTEVGEEE